MKIFIDDERMPPKGQIDQWVIARDPTTALGLIHANATFITHLSFDNDLGFKTEGRDILARIIGTPVQRPVALPRLEQIRVHSANTVANQAMILMAHAARKSGVIGEGVKIINRSALYENYPTTASWFDKATQDEQARLDLLIGTKAANSGRA